MVRQNKMLARVVVMVVVVAQSTHVYKKNIGIWKKRRIECIRKSPQGKKCDVFVLYMDNQSCTL